MPSAQELRRIKRRHAPQLLKQPGVSAVGIEKDENGEPVLTIHLEREDAEVRAKVAAAVEGHPVRFIVSGPYRKLHAG